jgi:hypothetical protein
MKRVLLLALWLEVVLAELAGAAAQKKRNPPCRATDVLAGLGESVLLLAV